MLVKVSKRPLFFSIIYLISFLLLILNLNYNVRTFRLTQDLQVLTLELQDLQRDVDLKELTYYTQTSLDKVYQRASDGLGMVRQSRVRVFTNDGVDAR